MSKVQLYIKKGSDPPEKVYLADEVAESFNVIPRRVRALAEARGVGTKIGGFWLFTRREIRQLRPGPPGAAGHRRPRGRPKSAREEEKERAAA